MDDLFDSKPDVPQESYTTDELIQDLKFLETFISDTFIKLNTCPLQSIGEIPVKDLIKKLESQESEIEQLRTEVELQSLDKS